MHFWVINLFTYLCVCIKVRDTGTDILPTTPLGAEVIYRHCSQTTIYEACSKLLLIRHIAKGQWNSPYCSKVHIFHVMSPVSTQFTPPKSKVFFLESHAHSHWQDHVLHPGREYSVVLKHALPFKLSVWKNNCKISFNSKDHQEVTVEVNILAVERESKPTKLNYVALISPSSSTCQTKHRLNTSLKENCEERGEPEDSMNQMV